jgi:hypothetical protein
MMGLPITSAPSTNTCRAAALVIVGRMNATFSPTVGFDGSDQCEISLERALA